MNRIATAAFAVFALFLSAPGNAHPLTCPSKAPADWGAHSAKLESIRILSAPPKYMMDEDALPIMAPSSQKIRTAMLYERWNMNDDAPAFFYQVDCMYEGTARYLRLDASTVKRCMSKSVKRKMAYQLISFRCD